MSGCSPAPALEGVKQLSGESEPVLSQEHFHVVFLVMGDSLIDFNFHDHCKNNQIFSHIKTNVSACVRRTDSASSRILQLGISADLKALTNEKTQPRDKSRPAASRFLLNLFNWRGSGRTVKNTHTLHPVRTLLAYLE